MFYVKHFPSKFDVAMGADDVAKMCELAVAFLSEKINEIFRKIEIGLYG